MLKRVLAWLVLLLVLTCSIPTAFALLAFTYSIFPSKILEGLLFLFPMGAPLVLICAGIVSLLPLSEYAYTRQAALNPAIARESIEHQSRAREKRGIGILLGIAGLISIIGINRWQLLYFSLVTMLDVSMVALLMTVTLALLILLYIKKLRQYGRSNTD